MSSSNPLKVSYCITCMDRVKQLFGDPDAKKGTQERSGTLALNLKAEKDSPNVEFVVLSYGKDPEMDRLMHERYQELIDSKRIRYAVYPEATKFKMGHAKNIAHRAATGDIVCNLDADNILAPDYSKCLAKQISENPNAMISHHPATLARELDIKIMDRVRRDKRQPGTGGRIALLKDKFMQLNGYDETGGWGPEDMDFTVAGHKQLGMTIVKPLRNLHGAALMHTNEDRLKNLSEKDKEVAEQLMNKNMAQNFVASVNRVLKSEARSRNPQGEFGVGTIYINFSKEPTELGSLEMDQDEYEASLKRDWVLKREMEESAGKPMPYRY